MLDGPEGFGEASSFLQELTHFWNNSSSGVCRRHWQGRKPLLCPKQKNVVCHQKQIHKIWISGVGAL